MRYYHNSGSRFEGKSLRAVDKDARQWRLIGPQRAIGCVVEPACEVVSPGVILHRTYDRFQIGEPGGTLSERVVKLSTVLADAGLAAPVRTDIRSHVWLKLFGNACFNPISLLTLATIEYDAIFVAFDELKNVPAWFERGPRRSAVARGLEIPG